MAKTFFIEIGSIGTVRSGNWYRSWNTEIVSCNALQIWEALFHNSNVQLAGDNLDGTHQPAGTYHGKFEHFLDENQIYLSGGNPEDGTYNINDLPAGFNIVEVFLYARATAGIMLSPPSGGQIKITSDFSGTTVFRDGFDNGFWKYIFNSVPTIFQLATSSVGIDITGDKTASQEFAGIVTGTLFAEGTYEIQTWTTEITSPTEIKTLANIDVQPIESVIIESDPDDPDAIDFTQLDPDTPIILEWELERATIMRAAIIHVTTIYLEFIIDVYLLRLIRGNGRVSVKILLKGGTQFDGEVSAGTLTILFFDGTGVYKIAPSRRNDLIYVEEDVTQEFKIPDPTIKTGYIGT